MTLTVSKLKSMLGSTKPFELSLSNSNGKKVLLDECVASTKLTVALLKSRYIIVFLGKKVQDNQIVTHLNKSENSDLVIVTKDQELDSRLGYSQSLLLTGKSLKENLHLIKKFTEYTLKNI